MKNVIILLLCFGSLPSVVFAQRVSWDCPEPANEQLIAIDINAKKPKRSERKYRQYVREIEQMVWNMQLPHFNLDTIPAKYKDAEAVMLAEYDSIEYRRVQRVVPYMGCVLPIPFFWKEIYTYRLHRTRIYINSQQAARDYAFVTYSKNDDVSISSIFGFIDSIVMGIRIIKPDGSVRTVDTTPYFKPRSWDQYYEADDRDTIRIGQLEPNDILDVFTWQKKTEKNEFHIFEPFSHGPLLHYDCRVKLDKHLNLQYRQMNGAPDFMQRMADGKKNILLSASLEDVDDSSAIQRQTAVIVRKTKKYFGLNLSPGVVANPPVNEVHGDRTLGNILETLDRNVLPTIFYKRDSLIYLAGIDSIISSGLTIREKADSLYNYIKNFRARSDISVVVLAVYTVSWDCLFVNALNRAGIPFDIAVTTPKGREPIDQLLVGESLKWFIRLKDGTCYFPMTSTPPGEIPIELKGRKAVLEDWETYFKL